MGLMLRRGVGLDCVEHDRAAPTQLRLAPLHRRLDADQPPRTAATTTTITR